MTNANRDDLEAAQLRAADLERDLVELRERNQKLEAELAGGETAEALANARRLAAAQRALAKNRGRLTATPGQRRMVGGYVGIVGAMIVVVALAHQDFGAAALALAIASVLVWLISRAGRGASDGRK